VTKLKLLALGIIVATSVSTAYAENQWSVGAGVGVINSPYKQYDRDIYPVPVITYEGDNFWFRGLGGGYYLWNDQTDKLSIMAYYDPTHFKPGDSDSYQLRQLDKRKSTMMAGISWVYITPNTVSCAPPWQAIRWITVTAISGIWRGCTVTPTAG